MQITSVIMKIKDFYNAESNAIFNALASKTKLTSKV